MWEEISSCKKAVYIISIICISVLFVAINSTTTSILANRLDFYDSAVFQIIGKCWADGLVPYKDLFDIKGPIILLINALGYGLFGSKIGVMILQIIFLFASLFTVFHFLKKSLSPIKSLIGVVVTCLTLGITYSSGNTVEEYSLPFLLLSFFFMYEWIEHLSEDSSHIPQRAFWYGFTFGFAFLTRLSNAIPLCTGVAMILLYLVYKKKWKNILGNAVYFMAGVLILIVPTIAYFYMKDALVEWWNCTFLFGFSYYGDNAHKASVILSNALISNVSLLALLGYSLFHFISKRRKNNLFIFLFWFSVLCASAYWIFTSRGYNHYSTIFLPFIVISISPLLSFDRWPKILAFIVIFLFVFRFSFRYTNSEIHKVRYGSETINAQYERLICEIPSEERSSVMIYNGEVTPYLYCGINPCCPYFYLQDENASISSLYKKHMIESFESCYVKWIIVTGEAKEINKILADNYKLLKSNDHELYLYKLNK